MTNDQKNMLKIIIGIFIFYAFWKSFGFIGVVLFTLIGLMINKGI